MEMKPCEYLEGIGACRESIEWVKQFDTLKEAWEKCYRGDWMLSAAQKLNVDIRVLALAKGLCANTVRHLMKDDRSVSAIDASIAFGRGEIDQRELSSAAAAANTATAAATYAATSAATYAAAAAATSAAAAANTATYASAHTDASQKNRKQTADICREILTKAVFEKLSGI